MRLHTSPLLDAYGRRQTRPIPPASVADAVAVYFRNSGRRAVTEWHPLLKCFVVKVSRKVDDPVMRLVREGKKSEDEVMEAIPLHDPVAGQAMTFRALDLEQMGPSGILRWLEEKDMWSGRGKYQSPHDAVAEADRETEARQAEKEQAGDERAREILRRTMRKHGLSAPQVSVGIQL